MAARAMPRTAVSDRCISEPLSRLRLVSCAYGAISSRLFAERCLDLLLDVAVVLAERLFFFWREQPERHAHHALRELDVQPVLAVLRAAGDMEVELAQTGARI